MQNIDETVIAKARSAGAFSALEHRFWSKVAIVEDDDSCWEWTKARCKGKNENYGKFGFIHPETGRRDSTPAQRVAYYLTRGVMPTVARHSCDNPPCCRPSHIRDGSQADNITDMDVRGRRRGRPQDGEANSMAALTEDLVRRARQRYAAGDAYEVIATEWNVSPSATRQAINGETWSHIIDIPPVTMRSFGGKLTPTQIEEAKAARQAGESCSSIARRMGCTPSNISYLTRDKAAPKQPRIRKNLNDETVRKIRLARTQGATYQAIADAHGISKGLVNHIVHSRAYAHVV